MLSTSRYAAIAAAGLLAGTGTAAASPAHSAPSAPSVTALAADTAFSNGSFETPLTPPNNWTVFSAGQEMGLWRVTDGSVGLTDDGVWQAAEGNQSLELNGTTTGSIAQTFTTEPGTKYSVTYSLAGNPNSTPMVKTGSINIDGQSFEDFSFDATGKTELDMGYVIRQFTFVANHASTTLEFASTTTGAFGPVIDDVKVKSCSSCGNCSGSCS